MEYTDDRKIIEVYVCQKLSKWMKFWQSYCKNNTVQFFCPTWYIISSDQRKTNVSTQSRPL